MTLQKTANEAEPVNGMRRVPVAHYCERSSVTHFDLISSRLRCVRYREIIEALFWLKLPVGEFVAEISVLGLVDS
jgi:hypothetical protein